jgi:molecular chaperone GrpE
MARKHQAETPDVTEPDSAADADIHPLDDVAPNSEVTFTQDQVTELVRRSVQEVQAEFRSYRDRVERQRDETTTAGLAVLVTELLGAIDHAELWATHINAQESPTDEARALLSSRETLLTALEKQGLRAIDEVGVAFDPAVHDPLELEDDPNDPEVPTVEAILRPGYEFRGIVLRPALIRLRA